MDPANNKPVNLSDVFKSEFNLLKQSVESIQNSLFSSPQERMNLVYDKIDHIMRQSIFAGDSFFNKSFAEKAGFKAHGLDLHLREGLTDLNSLKNKLAALVNFAQNLTPEECETLKHAASDLADQVSTLIFSADNYVNQQAAKLQKKSINTQIQELKSLVKISEKFVTIFDEALKNAPPIVNHPVVNHPVPVIIVEEEELPIQQPEGKLELSEDELDLFNSNISMQNEIDLDGFDFDIGVSGGWTRAKPSTLENLIKQAKKDVIDNLDHPVSNSQMDILIEQRLAELLNRRQGDQGIVYKKDSVVKLVETKLEAPEEEFLDDNLPKILSSNKPADPAIPLPPAPPPPPPFDGLPPPPPPPPFGGLPPPPPPPPGSGPVGVKKPALSPLEKHNATEANNLARQKKRRCAGEAFSEKIVDNDAQIAKEREIGFAQKFKADAAIMQQLQEELKQITDGNKVYRSTTNDNFKRALNALTNQELQIIIGMFFTQNPNSEEINERNREIVNRCISYSQGAQDAGFMETKNLIEANKDEWMAIFTSRGPVAGKFLEQVTNRLNRPQDNPEPIYAPKPYVEGKKGISNVQPEANKGMNIAAAAAAGKGGLKKMVQAPKPIAVEDPQAALLNSVLKRKVVVDQQLNRDPAVKVEPAPIKLRKLRELVFTEENIAQLFFDVKVDELLKIADKITTCTEKGQEALILAKNNELEGLRDQKRMIPVAQQSESHPVFVRIKELEADLAMIESIRHFKLGGIEGRLFKKTYSKQVREDVWKALVERKGVPQQQIDAYRIKYPTGRMNKK